LAWVETTSPSFTARHVSAHSDDAEAVLDALEAHRARLRDRFSRLPENVTVVLHDSSLQLSVARPYLPIARRLASPAARRYIAGWFATREVHVLAPECLRELAGGPESLEALMLTPQRVYTMLVAGSDNPLLPPPIRPRTLGGMLRAPWLLEGIAQYLAGQVPLLRTAISVRLREGPVRFPPTRRDSPLVAGVLFDLLAREHGEPASLRLARKPVDDPVSTLEEAFGARTTEIVSLWRAHLDRIESPKPDATTLTF
jgi:hypothetical protein